MGQGVYEAAPAGLRRNVEKEIHQAIEGMIRRVQRIECAVRAVVRIVIARHHVHLDARESARHRQRAEPGVDALARAERAALGAALPGERAFHPERAEARTEVGAGGPPVDAADRAFRGRAVDEQKEIDGGARGPQAVQRPIACGSFIESRVDAHRGDRIALVENRGKTVHGPCSRGHGGPQAVERARHVGPADGAEQALVREGPLLTARAQSPAPVRLPVDVGLVHVEQIGGRVGQGVGFVAERARVRDLDERARARVQARANAEASAEQGSLVRGAGGAARVELAPDADLARDRDAAGIALRPERARGAARAERERCQNPARQCALRTSSTSIGFTTCPALPHLL